MCKVYNTVGSLTYIKQHLATHRVTEFHTVRQLIAFQETYETLSQETQSTVRMHLEQERNALSATVLQLEETIKTTKENLVQQVISKRDNIELRLQKIAELDKGYLQLITTSFEVLYLLTKSNCLKASSGIKFYYATKQLKKLLLEKHKRLHYLTYHFENAVNVRSDLELSELNRKKKLIDEINNHIYGAIGEDKVAQELAHLSDEYVLINDFTHTFPKPLYYPPEKSYIRSIQIDHLLVSQAGIFLIETKNWSKASMQNLSLRSPVQQIQRANYALYKLISNNTNLLLTSHHWGDRRIPIRNLIVLINNKPNEEFQYVKILTTKELLGYIRYFKPVISKDEADGITQLFLKRLFV